MHMSSRNRFSLVVALATFVSTLTGIWFCGSTPESLTASVMLMLAFLAACYWFSIQMLPWPLFIAYCLTAISYACLLAGCVFAKTLPITVQEGGILPLWIIATVWARLFWIIATSTAIASVLAFRRGRQQPFGQALLVAQLPFVALCLFVAYVAFIA